MGEKEEQGWFSNLLDPLDKIILTIGGYGTSSVAAEPDGKDTFDEFEDDEGDTEEDEDEQETAGVRRRLEDMGSFDDDEEDSEDESSKETEDDHQRRDRRATPKRDRKRGPATTKFDAPLHTTDGLSLITSPGVSSSSTGGGASRRRPLELQRDYVVPHGADGATQTPSSGLSESFIGEVNPPFKPGAGTPGGDYGDAADADVPTFSPIGSETAPGAASSALTTAASVDTSDLPASEVMDRDSPLVASHTVFPAKAEGRDRASRDIPSAVICRDTEGHASCATSSSTRIGIEKTTDDATKARGSMASQAESGGSSSPENKVSDSGTRKGPDAADSRRGRRRFSVKSDTAWLKPKDDPESMIRPTMLDEWPQQGPGPLPVPAGSSAAYAEENYSVESSSHAGPESPSVSEVPETSGGDMRGGDMGGGDVGGGDMGGGDMGGGDVEGGDVGGGDMGGGDVGGGDMCRTPDPAAPTTSEKSNLLQEMEEQQWLNMAAGAYMEAGNDPELQAALSLSLVEANLDPQPSRGGLIPQAKADSGKIQGAGRGGRLGDDDRLMKLMGEGGPGTVEGRRGSRRTPNGIDHVAKLGAVTDAVMDTKAVTGTGVMVGVGSKRASADESVAPESMWDEGGLAPEESVAPIKRGRRNRRYRLAVMRHSSRLDDAIHEHHRKAANVLSGGDGGDVLPPGTGRARNGHGKLVGEKNVEMPPWPDRAWRPYDTPIVDFSLPALQAAALAGLGFGADTLIVCSPFRRCLQTAGVVARTLGVESVTVRLDVGERMDKVRKEIAEVLDAGSGVDWDGERESRGKANRRKEQDQLAFCYLDRREMLNALGNGVGLEAVRGKQPPEDESGTEAKQRFMSSIARFRDEYLPERSVLVIAHGDTLDAAGESLASQIIYEASYCAWAVFDLEDGGQGSVAESYGIQMIPLLL